MNDRITSGELKAITDKASKAELNFALQLRDEPGSFNRAGEFAWEREYVFDEKRGWRLDFALPHPDWLIAVEVEAHWGHRTVDRYRRDCEKYNAAQNAGWIVLRGDGQMVEDGSLLAAVRVALAKS